jgi:hypothetical protein
MNEDRENGSRWTIFANVAAVCASVIAVCALGLTIWQAQETHKHNRLLVLPILDLSFSESTYAITLTNAGIGPAHITNVSLFVDGEKIPASTQSPGLDWDAFFDRLQLNKLCFIFRSMHDTWLVPNEEVALIKARTGGTPDECSLYKLSLFEQLHRVSGKIDYESIYEEEFSFDTSFPAFPESNDLSDFLELKIYQGILDPSVARQGSAK